MAKAYEMEMVFSVSVELRQINDFMAQMGIDDKIQIRDAVSVSLKQVLPIIPDDDYLRKVADVIKDTYKTRDIAATKCRFTGYKYIREITVKEDDDV